MKTHHPLPIALCSLALLGAFAGCDEKRGTSLTFEPDVNSDDSGLVLRLRSLTPAQIELEVVGQGLPNVYGLAFRLSYLPASLRLVSVTSGDGWPASALVHGVEPTPGLTVGAVTLRGDAEGAAALDRVLALVTFDVLGTSVTPVTLVPVKTRVAASDGTWVNPVALQSGQLVRR